MKKCWKTIPLVLGLLFSMHGNSQVKIIFDTDFGGDADDLGALAMLNHFIDKKQCAVLAVMNCSAIKSTVSAIDAVNRFYKHPNIPIGTNKVGTFSDSSYYSDIIARTFPFEQNSESVPDATVLYRQILAKSRNKSRLRKLSKLSFQNLGIYLIEKYYGKEIGNYAAKIFFVEKGKHCHLTYQIFSAQKNHYDEQILESQDFVEKNAV